MEFLQIAEDTDLIMPITDWVLEASSRQIAEWKKEFPNYPHLSVSVNLSPKYFMRKELHERIRKLLSKS